MGASHAPIVDPDAFGSSSTVSPLLRVLSESIRAMDDGRSVHEVICRGLAHVLPASAAAFVRLDRELRQCAVVCWSGGRSWTAITRTPFEPVAGQYRGPDPRTRGRWRDTLAFARLLDGAGTFDFLEMELTRTASETRLVVFGRHDPFGEREIRILAQCQDVISAVDRHMSDVHRLATPHGRNGQPAVAATRAPHLTDRELEVLSWLRQGMKATSIARRLGISTRTVNKHLANIYRKLGAHDRLLAVSRAQSLGMLPQDAGAGDGARAT
jgi:DNA-binding CsgD family transcriptional regulator